MTEYNHDPIFGRMFDVLTRTGKIGRLWTDDQQLLGFIAESAGHQERMTSRLIAAVHSSRMDRVPPQTAFDRIVGTMVADREIHYSGGSFDIAFDKAQSKPGEIGGAPSIQLASDDNDNVCGLSYVENNWCYVRENGLWVEPFGPDDYRFYESSVVATSLDAVRVYDAVMSTGRSVSVDTFYRFLRGL